VVDPPPMPPIALPPIAVALLTCDRPGYTVRTALSFRRHNPADCWQLLHADDASTADGMPGVVRGLGFETVVAHKTRRGYGPTLRELAAAARDRVGPGGLVLVLENDFFHLRPLPLDVVAAVFARPEIGVLRLWGDWKSKRHRLRDRSARRADWQPWAVRGERLEIDTPEKRVRWSTNPIIVRAGLLASITAESESERAAMRVARKLDHLTARFVENVTTHIGTRSTPAGVYGNPRRDKPKKKKRKKKTGTKCAGSAPIHSHAPILKKLCEQIRPEAILEWGPGASTAALREAAPHARILTIEHDPTYYQKARAQFAHCDRVEVKHLVIGTKGRSQGYITYPFRRLLRERAAGSEGEGYDLIFVDGRHRVDCLTVASLLLAPGGVVALHDAERPRYERGLAVFPEVRNVGAGVAIAGENLDRFSF